MSRILLLSAFLCALITTAIAGETPRPTVLVSIAPYRHFVEKIAEDTVSIEVLVPAGSSSHSYEPRPKQVVRISKAAVWFRIGEPSEQRTKEVLLAHNPRLHIINLSKGLDLIHDNACGTHCHHASFDPHIWLSPRLMQQQIEAIADALITLQPEYRSLYIANLQKLFAELTALDAEITDLFADSTTKTVMVSHPAYGYFCRDYQVQQLSVEFEGKEPTPRRLQELLDTAKQHTIHTLFLQKQYPNKGAQLVAKELRLPTKELDPYAEDYFQALRTTAHLFAGKE